MLRRASEQIEWLDNRTKWKGLPIIAAVKAKRSIGESVSEEIRHYLSGLPANTERLSAIIRDH